MTGIATADSRDNDGGEVRQIVPVVARQPHSTHSMPSTMTGWTVEALRTTVVGRALPAFVAADSGTMMSATSACAPHGETCDLTGDLQGLEAGGATL